MKKYFHKHAAITLIVIFYLIMTFQSYMPYKEYRPLAGNIKKVQDTVFTWKGWFDESYQKKKEKYLNQNFGFRPMYVRVHNQIGYWMYNKIYAKSVVVGKNGYLFEENYLNAATGRDLLAQSRIDSKIDTLLMVRDELKKHGTEMLIIFAPGKGSFYPEYIPDEYGRPSAITNYSRFRDRINKTDLDFIDYHSWFDKMKDTSKITLYPKTGIHWSLYSVSLVTDSLLKYMKEKYNAQIPKRTYMPDHVFTDGEKKTDVDVEDGANLLFPLSRIKLDYKYFEVDRSTPPTFSVITISDSFYWQIFGDGTASYLFKDAAFYYYFGRSFYGNGVEEDIDPFVSKYDEVNKYNLALFIVTDANLPWWDWGFSKNYLEKRGISLEEYKLRLLMKIDEVRDSEGWMKMLKARAIEKNRSLNDMVYEAASWSVRENLLKQNIPIKIK